MLLYSQMWHNRRMSKLYSEKLSETILLLFQLVLFGKVTEQTD